LGEGAGARGPWLPPPTNHILWCVKRTLQRLGAHGFAPFFLDLGVGCGHAGDGDAHGGTGHVVEADAVTELDGLGLAAVFPADADLQIRTGLAAFGDRVLHEPAHP